MRKCEQVKTPHFNIAVAVKSKRRSYFTTLTIKIKSFRLLGAFVKQLVMFKKA
jgi:hypothetical protein